jgi:hypothetical protein
MSGRVPCRLGDPAGGLIPILGRLVWFAAVVFGLGALAVVIWWGRSAAGVAPAA